jgi:tRNA/rRNA methyltransferase
MKRLSVAMVEPEFSINVGYVARIMANFGLAKLILVNRDKGRIDLEEATKFAAHGAKVVRDVRYFASVSDVRKRFRLLVGTTAIRATKKSNINRKTIGPEECGQVVRENYFSHLVKGERNEICLLLGRDTTGLSNEELSLCDIAVTATTGSDYNTLNVSHAAAIILYCFRKEFEKTLENKGAAIGSARSVASRAERERLVSLYLELARLSDFQGFKISKLQKALEGVFARSNPNLRELHLLMGVASRAILKLRRSAHSNT